MRSYWPPRYEAPPRHGTADIGLLISILGSAETPVWRNVAHSLHSLRPRWSSLAVDIWDRPENCSALEARRGVYARHAEVLALFSRVLFLDSAPRRALPSHIRPSFSYRMHWQSAFADRATRDNFGHHSEGLPELLAGLDADVYVPKGLPLHRIARTLADATPPSNASVAETEAIARWAWVDGIKPKCRSAAEEAAAVAIAMGTVGAPQQKMPSTPGSGSSSRSRSRSSSRSSSRSRTTTTTTTTTTTNKNNNKHALALPASWAKSSQVKSSERPLCEVVSPAHSPLYVSPKDLAGLHTDRRMSYSELGNSLFPLHMGNVRARTARPCHCCMVPNRPSRACERVCMRPCMPV